MPFHFIIHQVKIYICLIENNPVFEKPGVTKGDVYLGIHFKYLPEFSFLLMSAGLDKGNYFRFTCEE